MRQSGETLQAGPPAEEAGGLLTIDLDALAANWRFLQGRVGRAECAAVVKADAYGIGLEPAVRALGRAGCRTFFVAHLSEAIACPDSLPGRDGVRAERLPAGHLRRLRPLRPPARPRLAGGDGRVGGLLPRSAARSDRPRSTSTRE